MRTVAKIVLVILALGLVVIGGGVGWGLMKWDRTWDAPTPSLQASTDSAVIARGRYLAYGPGRCVECHIALAEVESVQAGAMPPLAGGLAFPTPVGTFYTPNLTPHASLGIGGLDDGQLARAIRHGVRHDGRAMLPFMEFQNVSDEDLRALLSFLRSQPPVAREVPAHQFNLAGKMVMAYMLKPVGPSGTPPAASPAESATVERGAYIAEALGTCAACHTRRSKTDGSYQGPRYAGGSEFGAPGDTATIFVSPNLTPGRPGRLNGWTEDQFLVRFRAGALLPGTPMPWRPYSRLSDTDLRALYRFLRTLPADDTDPGPSMRKRNAGA